MKKLFAIGLCLVMCFSFSACGNNVKDEKSDNHTSSSAMEENLDDQTSSQISNQKYTYTVHAMQGVDDCIYYGPDAHVPNSPNPEAARNKIHVWTKCITCGKNGQHFTIPVNELNFSNGDTIQYNGTDSCWDCRWDKGMESFMWAIQITRIADE